jgi:hypothetical protein
MSRRTGRSVVVQGSQVLTFTVAQSNQSASLNISPATFTRTNSLQGSFEFYRFTRLKVEVLPAWQTASTTLADVGTVAGTLGYLPEQLTATSTTISQATASQMDPHVSHTVGLNVASTGVASGQLAGTTMSKIMNVSRRRLLSTPVKMYVCAASSEDALVQQGTLVYALDTANSASQFVVMFADVHYTCEFFVPTDSSLTLVKPQRVDDDSKEDDQLVMCALPPLRSKGASLKRG